MNIATGVHPNATIAANAAIPAYPRACSTRGGASITTTKATKGGTTTTTCTAMRYKPTCTVGLSMTASAIRQISQIRNAAARHSAGTIAPATRRSRLGRAVGATAATTSVSLKPRAREARARARPVTSTSLPRRQSYTVPVSRSRSNRGANSTSCGASLSSTAVTRMPCSAASAARYRQ